ncbi:MAG: histidine phosphatase family protein, partial [Clostridia bacterium]|nr:histidine phosphatase family protein [Clostridia bacterium]
FFGCSLEKMPQVQWYDNTSVTIIDYEDGKFKVELEGDASHLDKELSTIQNQEWWNEYKKRLEENMQGGKMK